MQLNRGTIQFCLRCSKGSKHEHRAAELEQATRWWLEGHEALARFKTQLLSSKPGQLHVTSCKYVQLYSERFYVHGRHTGSSFSLMWLQSSRCDLLHHDGQVDGRARVSVSQLEHQLLFFLRKLLVYRCLPLQRHPQVLLFFWQLPKRQRQIKMTISFLMSFSVCNIVSFDFFTINYEEFPFVRHQDPTFDVKNTGHYLRRDVHRFKGVILKIQWLQ